MLGLLRTRAGGRALLRVVEAEQGALALLFFVTRGVLHSLGLRLNFDIGWMFLSDPRWLREHLAASVFYFHAYPPGMNLLTGVLLKIGGEHAAGWALAVFWGLGLVLVESLYVLCRQAGVGRRSSFATAAAFSLTPACLYFEHLYLWEYPVAALLCLAGALFCAALKRSSSGVWAVCFLVCAAIGWVRSTFHLVWFVAMVALAVGLTRAGLRRRPLVAAIGPFALLLALYVKNLALFGFFGAMSAGAGNMTHVTVSRLPRELREEWGREGKLSPFANISVYAGPSAYSSYFRERQDPRYAGIEDLNALERPTVHAANYNHWYFFEINEKRRADALFTLRERPQQYLATVWLGLQQIFSSSTHWHPYDQRNGSPHYEHRKVLGRYERAYDALVHQSLFEPVGVYVLLPLLVIWAGYRFVRRWRSATPSARVVAAGLAFSVAQIGFVVTVSSLFTIGESSRYRFQIEALIWVLGAACAARLWRRARQRA